MVSLRDKLRSQVQKLERDVPGADKLDAIMAKRPDEKTETAAVIKTYKRDQAKAVKAFTKAQDAVLMSRPVRAIRLILSLLDSQVHLMGCDASTKAVEQSALDMLATIVVNFTYGPHRWNANKMDEWNAAYATFRKKSVSAMLTVLNSTKDVSAAKFDDICKYVKTTNTELQSRCSPLAATWDKKDKVCRAIKPSVKPMVIFNMREVLNDVVPPPK